MSRKTNRNLLLVYPTTIGFSSILSVYSAVEAVGKLNRSGQLESQQKESIFAEIDKNGDECLCPVLWTR